MNGLLRPLVWAAAAVLVITAFGLVIDSWFFDHDTTDLTLWLADIVRNIILVATGFVTANAYQHRKNGTGS